jgi:glycosyltransferase involved in cell wall biosynthesis
MPFLQILADKLGLGPEDVIFGDVLSGSEYDAALGKSHIYLLPSLRENAGLTMMEAMLAGCVPIVLKLGGPGEIVKEQCGFAIPADRPDAVIAQIVSSLRKLHWERSLCQTLGEAASERIASHYSESAYLNSISGIYRKLKS